MKHYIALIVLLSTASAFGQVISRQELRQTNSALRAEIAQKAATNAPTVHDSTTVNRMTRNTLVGGAASTNTYQVNGTRVWEEHVSATRWAIYNEQRLGNVMELEELLGHFLLPMRFSGSLTVSNGNIVSDAIAGGGTSGFEWAQAGDTYGTLKLNADADKLLLRGNGGLQLADFNLANGSALFYGEFSLSNPGSNAAPVAAAVFDENGKLQRGALGSGGGATGSNFSAIAVGSIIYSNPPITTAAIHMDPTRFSRMSTTSSLSGDFLIVSSNSLNGFFHYFLHNSSGSTITITLSNAATASLWKVDTTNCPNPMTIQLTNNTGVEISDTHIFFGGTNFGHFKREYFEL